MPKPLVLASGSPFRQALLTQLGIPFEAFKASIDERDIENKFKGPIEELAEHLSEKKAESLLESFSDRPIVGSDQVLLFEGKTFSKPESIEEVIDRLATLQGKTHILSTGICLLYQGEIYRDTVTAKMKMHSLSINEIHRYAELDQPIGCAGGYMIEKKGPLLFESIETLDHNSIVGLPVLKLISYLRDLKLFSI